MKVPTPHFLLFSDARGSNGAGRWQFQLRSADGSEQFSAGDVEPGVQGERLDLLTIVRALESLDQPSRVTLVGCSRHVRHGMQYGLSEWRDNGWRWESFGHLVPVRNGDLWQRIDRALRDHQVECRRRRIDPPHGPSPGDCPDSRVSEDGTAPVDARGPVAATPAGHASRGTGVRISVSRQNGLRYRLRLQWVRLRRWSWALWRQRGLRSWTALRPCPRSG